jgi:diguanylate cyclase (GGDEF)-like protein/PAS domain S-box-containing protein
MSTLDKKTEIQFEQLRQLYSENIIPLVTSVILAGILAVMQRDVISSTVLLAWFSLITLIMVLRTILTLAYQRSSSDSKNRTYLWLLRFRLGILVSAVIWGAAGFLLFPADEPQHQMFLLFTLAGLTAGAVTSYAADVVSALVFSIVVLTPIIIRLFLIGESLYLAMSLATTLYLGYLVISFRHINRNISDNIVLRLEAIDREATVKTSEEHYRLLLSYSPVGIFHYDLDLTITYSNTYFAEILNSSIESVIGLNMKTIGNNAIMPTLINALAGEVGVYEGHYIATFIAADVWVSMTCAPFKNNKGVIIGGIGIVQDISERKLAEEEIKSLALYDPLTGLPNRRFLQVRLNQALVSSTDTGRRGALLFLDLDHFKLLNDSRGHDIGDLLLKQVADRLCSCLREDDFVARLGGDEFLVMIENLSEQLLEACTETELIAHKILITLNEIYFLDQYEYRNDSSIGIVLFNGHDHSQDEFADSTPKCNSSNHAASRNLSPKNTS